MNENAQLWVEALRSGEYKQTTGALHRARTLGAGDQDGYCCLGVACAIYRKAGGELVVREQGFGGQPIYSYDGEWLGLPPAVRTWLGLRTLSGAYNKDEDIHHSLMNDNDGGKTFEEIADIIESEPKDLFR